MLFPVPPPAYLDRPEDPLTTARVQEIRAWLSANDAAEAELAGVVLLRRRDQRRLSQAVKIGTRRKSDGGFVKVFNAGGQRIGTRWGRENRWTSRRALS